MIYRWCEFFDLARGLYSSPSTLGPEEASFRSSISRAYYAAFHCARTFAQANGLTVRNPRHSDVIDFFVGSGSSAYRTIGNQLDDARTNREKADYRDDFRGRSPNYVAGKMLKLITDIMKALDTLQSAQ